MNLRPNKFFTALCLLGGAAAGIRWMMRKALHRPTGRKLPGLGSRERALALCRAIYGNDKSAIFAILGPPGASAGFSTVAPAMLVRSDYLHADTWYYPLDRHARTALAVRFNGSIASDAQLVSLSSGPK